MAKVELDARTLRWASRKLRRFERQFRSIPDTKDRFENAYRLGRVHSYAIASGTVLNQARAIEKAKKGKR